MSTPDFAMRGSGISIAMSWFVLLLLLVFGSGSVAGASSPDEAMAVAAEAFRAGNFQAALNHWLDAADSYEAEGDNGGRIRALARSADARVAMGYYPSAVNTLNIALEAAKKTDDSALKASVTASLGNAYALAGQAAWAEQQLESAVTLAREAGAAVVLANALNNLGNLHATEGDLDQAAAVYSEAVSVATQGGDHGLSVRASINLARVDITRGLHQQAAATLDQLAQQIGTLPDSHTKAYDQISVGRLYARLALEQPESRVSFGRQAFRQLEAASRTADSVGDARAQSYAQGYLGELYEHTGQYPQALDLTQNAVFSAQRAAVPEALYRWQWQTGRILRAQGNDDQAIVAYQQSIATLRGIRQDMDSGFRGAVGSFRDTVGPVYFELADLLLQRSAEVGDPQASRDLLREARDTVELVKGAELEDYFQDDCVARLRAKTTGIDQLATGTAAIYPIILSDRTELLVSLPEGLQRFTVAVDRDTFTAEVRTFRRKLEKRTTHQYYPHARRLYQWVIEPIEPELTRQGIDTLVIVPDGALRTIPMSALHDGKQFLGQRYALATTPGLTLTDPRPIERKDVKVLLTGLTDAVQGFPALPYVGQEIEDIEAIYGGTVLENQAFVKANLEQALRDQPFNIVHIASHAQFDSDITKTFLLTYDSKLSMDGLESFLGLARFRQQNAVELLTLSACQTAAGDDRAALGLAGVAVKAGARSAVATLWTVNDPASALLVAEFYGNLKDPQVSKAKALQQAQARLLADPRYRHPSYWSPFLLIGNWL